MRSLFFAGSLGRPHTIRTCCILCTKPKFKKAGDFNMANCGLFHSHGEGIDSSLLFFFLLLVVIFCNCGTTNNGCGC